MELVIIPSWILLSFAAGFYAVRLNRTALWTLTALFLSPLVAFVFLFALGRNVTDDVERVPCPFCAEDIKPEALVCPHCRTDLSRPSPADRLRPR